MIETRIYIENVTDHLTEDDIDTNFELDVAEKIKTSISFIKANSDQKKDMKILFFIRENMTIDKVVMNYV